MNFRGRIDKVVSALEEAGVDALLVSNLANVRYLTGFSGSNGQVLVRRDGPTFFTDGRYEAQAGELVQEAPVEIYYTRLTDALKAKVEGIARLGVEGRTMTLSERDDLDERLGGPELVSTSDVVEKLRRSKEQIEIELISQAIALGDRAYEWIRDRLVPGATEAQIALDLEVYMRSNGADRISFDPIVGSGPLSAHIHHTPSDRVFEKGDLVLLDLGAVVDGYCGDLTRTAVIGPATDAQQEIYTIVLEAQEAALGAMRPGVSGRDVDAAARRVIEDAGHGEHFGHGLGHGVGLEIHEAPRLARISEHTLVAADVVTNEPGIYIVGKGGIRIEDCVLITESGAEVLTRAPKDTLIEL